jgi:hypothetical protein
MARPEHYQDGGPSVDMARFTMQKRFSLVVIAYRAFQHLLTIEDQRSCLLHVRRHLRRKGLPV